MPYLYLPHHRIASLGSQLKWHATDAHEPGCCQEGFGDNFQAHHHHQTLHCPETPGCAAAQHNKYMYMILDRALARAKSKGGGGGGGGEQIHVSGNHTYATS